MRRCLQLAGSGAGHVAPNPMVGAVLVHEGRIIGEGFHRKYGEAHAEVNCINDAIANGHEGLLSKSVIYVSLEPCAHFGKTPPCADLIIRHSIPEVIIGCRDPFEAVNGRGIEKLATAGVRVRVGVSEEECLYLNRRFFTFHTRKRPYIILKWAETEDGFIGATAGRQRLMISNACTDREVHKWRTREAAILVGTETVRQDNPRLTARLWPGPSPLRLVIDRNLRLNADLHVFDGEAPTIVFNTIKEGKGNKVDYHRIGATANLAQELASALYGLNVISVLVEGGRQLIQAFIDAGLWDEARVIENTELRAGGGVPAPVLLMARKAEQHSNTSDTITTYRPAADAGPKP